MEETVSKFEGWGRCFSYVKNEESFSWPLVIMEEVFLDERWLVRKVLIRKS